MDTKKCPDNMVPIVYRGGRGRHLVPSPLRKVPNYGMHTYGDTFCVHFDDQAKLPGVFEKLELKQPPPPIKPKVERPPEEKPEEKPVELVDPVETEDPPTPEVEEEGEVAAEDKPKRSSKRSKNDEE